MRRWLAYFLLLYPSMPYFSFGWGTNMPFFIAAILFLSHYPVSRLRRVPWNNLLWLYITAFPLAAVATMVMYYKVDTMGFTSSLLGARELGTDFFIMLALLGVFREYEFDFIRRGLTAGLVLNLAYGFLATVIPGISLSSLDYIFHEPSVNEEYLLRDENRRVRLLWHEPSQAATYLIVTLPLIFLVRRKSARYALLLASISMFLKVASKGAIVFLGLALPIFVLVRPVGSFRILVKSAPLLLIVAVATLPLAMLLQSELVLTADYIAEIFKVFFSTELYTSSLEDRYTFLAAAGVNESQYIRLANVLSVIQGFLCEPYAFITGFSPFGMKYIYYLHPEVVPENLQRLENIMNYGPEEMNLARKLVQSGILEMYVSYGIGMLIFLLKTLRCYWRQVRTVFPKQKDYLLLHLIWVALCFSLMIQENTYITFFTLYLLGNKLQEAWRSRIQVFSPDGPWPVVSAPAVPA